jgi:predicted ATPase
MVDTLSIESIRFRNYRVLPNTDLSLGRFTLIVGPNGSGKSTALRALEAIKSPGSYSFPQVVSLDTVGDPNRVELAVRWQAPANLQPGVETLCSWTKHQNGRRHHQLDDRGVSDDQSQPRERFLAGMQVFALDPRDVAAATQIAGQRQPSPSGAQLAGVLDYLRDEHEPRFQSIRRAIAQWLPEFDDVGVRVPGNGQKVFWLRTAKGQHHIEAGDLSHGTLFAMALLALANLPEPPSLVALEEPDRGIHPRLMRHLQEAMYRLSFPENYGDPRAPVQVIATTHSPYLLDLYKDHPEQVVIAQKKGQRRIIHPPFRNSRGQ